MSSTSKRPRAHASAPGEVVTNWTIVRIVVGLAVLAGGCVAFNIWSSCARQARDEVAKTVTKEESSRAAPVKSRRAAGRELVLFTRPGPQAAIEPDRPPLRSPGPALPPERAPILPEEVVVLVGNDAGPASSDEFTAKAQPPAHLVTLDERALLRQLGFGRGLDDTLDELSASGQIPLSVVASHARDPRIVDIDLNTEKGTIEKLLKMVEAFAPPSRGRGASRAAVIAIEKEEKAAAANNSQKDDTVPAWAKAKAPADAWLDLVAKRTDLQGLPYRKGTTCQLDSESSTNLGAISQELGRTLARGARRGDQPYLAGNDLLAATVAMVDRERAHLVTDLRSGAHRTRSNETDPDVVVPALVQMLQARSTFERGTLVDALASIRGRNATAALAQRAVFELSKDAREKAVTALKQRPVTEIRPYLLAGLRYPWAAIADHAAEALVGLDDRSAAGELVKLLDEPDPTAPFVNDSGKWAVRELVRVNHLRSCFLCHAPSLSSTDPVRGVVPVPGQPLPQQYYQESRGVFVRADVTYLKQDFSLTHPVKGHGNVWLDTQRFDYLVRTRELTPAEVAKRQLPSPDVGSRRTLPDEQDYPQREAVVYALRKLTNYDAGRSAVQWTALVKMRRK